MSDNEFRKLKGSLKAAMSEKPGHMVNVFDSLGDVMPEKFRKKPQK